MLLGFLAGANVGTVPAPAIAAGAALHMCFSGDSEKSGNRIDIAGLA